MRQAKSICHCPFPSTFPMKGSMISSTGKIVATLFLTTFILPVMWSGRSFLSASFWLTHVVLPAACTASVHPVACTIVAVVVGMPFQSCTPNVEDSPLLCVGDTLFHPMFDYPGYLAAGKEAM